jgi:hypothetical protein
MVGRPRKQYKEGETPYILHITITEGIRRLIPEEANLSEEIRQYLLIKYGDPKKGELANLKKRRDKLQSELISLNAQIQEKEREIDEQEKLRIYVEAKNLYAIWVFWNIVKDSVKRGILVWSDYDKVETIFGITLNFKELKNDIEKKEIIQYSVETFEQARELAKKYNVKYLGNGLKEKEEFDKFIKFYENYMKKGVKI